MAGVRRNRAYRFRAYPDASQRELFAKTFGCVRFVYNRMLSDKIEYYEQTGRSKVFTPARYKSEFEWLKEVDSLALANAQLNLQRAYRSFFREKSAGYPKFKSRKNPMQSYTTNNVNGSIRVEGTGIRLPKAGAVRVKMHRQIPPGHEIKGATVTREATGKYYISVLTEYIAEEPSIETDVSRSIGLDYSSGHFYMDSLGNSADMPSYYREAEKRLADAQRRLSKMVKGSKNYCKQKIVVAKLHEKVRNQRLDWQNKRSLALAEEYDIICLEDINLKNISGGLKLGKATMDNGFGQFRNMLIQKMEERGKKVVMIDKWYPSSKTCSRCGYINAELKLSDRSWKCPECGSEHDRDINAAVNILNEGIRLYMSA